MKNRYIFFLGFIALLYVLFLRVDFSNNKQKKNEPNFVLMGASIEHFVQGELEFEVEAETIEIYDKEFVMQNSTILMKEGAIISASIMTYYPNINFLHASTNVYFSYGEHIYTGNELEYDMKRLLLKAYNGGKFQLK